MPDQTSTIISKVWGMCGPLRDDGVSYGDYLEQLTYLIFLKMSDEYAKPPYNRQTGIPEGYGWADMSDLKGAELEGKYKAILETLGEQGGTLGKIFKGATNKINNAAILYRIVQMIDKEKWVSMSTDVKGEIYEGLLQKNAEDVKSGAGQYFTPRPLIQAMVECIRPEHRRPLLRQWRLFAGGSKLSGRSEALQPGPRGKGVFKEGSLPGLGNCSQYLQDEPDESLPSQYRRPLRSGAHHIGGRPAHRSR